MIIDRYFVTDRDRAEGRTVLIAKGAAAPAAPAPRHRAQFARGLFGWVLFLALAVMLYMLLSRDNARLGRRLVPSGHLWVGMIAFAAGVGAVFASFLMLRRLRWAEARRQGPAHVTFSEDGLTETRGAVRRLAYWSAFHSFAETPHLFVLRERPDFGRVFPKRQFADDAAIEATRQLLAAKLARPPEALPPEALPPEGAR